MTDKTNDFDIAKAIFEQLENVEKDRRLRILRWVAESLGFTEMKNPGTPGSLSGLPGDHEHDLPLPGASATARTKSMDIKTFLDNKKPKSDVHFATVVAYYYRFEALGDQRQESIGAEALREAARLAGRKRLERPHLTLNNAKKMGYLDSAGRGAFKINTVGENLVAMTLPSPQTNSQERLARRQRTPKSGTKKK